MALDESKLLVNLPVRRFSPLDIFRKDWRAKGTQGTTGCPEAALRYFSKVTGLADQVALTSAKEFEFILRISKWGWNILHNTKEEQSIAEIVKVSRHKCFRVRHFALSVLWICLCSVIVKQSSMDVLIEAISFRQWSLVELNFLRLIAECAAESLPEHLYAVVITLHRRLLQLLRRRQKNRGWHGPMSFFAACRPHAALEIECLSLHEVEAALHALLMVREDVGQRVLGFRMSVEGSLKHVYGELHKLCEEAVNVGLIHPGEKSCSGVNDPKHHHGDDRDSIRDRSSQLSACKANAGTSHCPAASSVPSCTAQAAYRLSASEASAPHGYEALRGVLAGHHGGLVAVAPAQPPAWPAEVGGGKSSLPSLHHEAGVEMQGGAFNV